VKWLADGKLEGVEASVVYRSMQSPCLPKQTLNIVATDEVVYLPPNRPIGLVLVRTIEAVTRGICS
jgi:hypothetical protein